MMKIKNKPNKKIIVATFIALFLVIAIGIFVVVKSKDNAKKTTTINDRPILQQDDINFNPPSDKELDDSQNRKAKQIEDIQKNEKTSITNLSISLIAAAQDNTGGPLVVRSMVDGATTGKCTITVTNTLKSYTVDIVSFGTYFGCQATDIPASELSNGKQTLTVSAYNEKASGKISQEVDIKK